MKPSLLPARALHRPAGPRAVPALLGSVLAATCVLPQSATANPDRPVELADAGITVEGVGQRNANPNAQPSAPYKVNRSQDSKYTEPLRDTPKTVTAIPKEVIEDMGAHSFRDVVRAQPGVTLGTGEGGNAFGDRIFIRGFEARNDVYIDGMRDPGVTSREIFAVEQIEVVKGPSSSFGGRGTTGGSVSLQSKQALDRDFVVAEATGGSDALFRGTVDLNQSNGSTLAVRVNGLYHTGDTPGRDHVHQRRSGVAVALRWTPSDALTVKADVYHARLDGLPDYGHPFDVDTQRPYKVDRDNFYGVVGRDFLLNGADVGTLSLTWEPDARVRLRTMNRYGRTFNRYVVSVPRAPTRVPADDIAQWTVAAGATQRNAVNSYFANITDATVRFSTFGASHTLVTGFEYAHERVTAARFAFPQTVEDSAGNIIATPGGFVRNLLDPDPVLGFDIPALRDTAPPTVTTVETVSLFLIDTIQVAPRLEAVLGLRFDDYRITQQRIAGTASSGAAVAAVDLVNKARFVNGQASLVYKPAEATSLYVSFSTSSNPSGEQLDAVSIAYDGLSAQNADLEPERNTAWEIGAKQELFDGAMLLNAALFRITKENAREQVLPGVFDTVGKLRSQGFELGVSGNLTPRLSLFGGYTYLDATVRDAANPALEGGRFPNVPRHTFSLLATYRLTDALTLGGQAHYQDAIHGGSTVAGSAHVPGFWRFDAVARYRFSTRFEARLNVLNLADKVYYDAIYRSATPFAYIAPGRSASLALKASF